MTHHTNHPEKETDYLCMKHQNYVVERSLHCRDPQSYCKFRTSCPMYFLSKESNAEMIEDATKEGSNLD
jgi:hypothetical protein